jgi:hypothetical protein
MLEEWDIEILGTSTKVRVVLNHHFIEKLPSQTNTTKEYHSSNLCTLLHHKDETHYVLTKYILPINNNNLQASVCCKFTQKECMVVCSKVFVCGALVDN